MRNFAILLCILFIFSCSKRNDPQKAVVSYCIGKVTIEHLNSSTERARTKSLISLNDTIITHKKSQAIVQIPDVGTVRILENSRVFFNSFTENKAGSITTLFKGSIFSKILKNQKQYKVLSKTFTASAKETQFLVNKNDFVTEALVYKGDVIVTALETKKQSNLTAGQAGSLLETKELLVRDLDQINVLRLKKLAVPEYIKNIEDLKKEELNTINNKNRTKEKKIQQEIDSLNEQLEQAGKATVSKEPDSKLFTLIAEYKGHKYYLSKFKSSWDNAQEICNNYGGHLATLTSLEEHTVVYKGIWNNNPYYTIWIGLKRIKKTDKWEWVTGEKYKYNRWHPGQPDNLNNNQNRAQIWENSGYKTWDDENTDSEKNFLLEIK